MSRSWLLAKRSWHGYEITQLKNKGKQQRSRETIKTILGAAAQVLIGQGYEKATTNRIAECAGYSVGTLYQYFDDKEDIYGELIDQALVELLRAAVNCPIQACLEETLKELLARVIRGLEQNPALIQALQELLVGQFRYKRNAAYESIIASTTRLLEAHRSEIVVDDLRLAARIIVGAAEGVANSGEIELMQHHDLEAHLLRLQLAYLTRKS